MDVQSVIDRGIYDNFALIISPEDEHFVRTHLGLFPERIVKATGICVKGFGSGIFYHITAPENEASILANGMLPSSEYSSYGPGVYTYRHTRCFNQGLLVTIGYNGPYLENICDYEKDELCWGECVLDPRYLKVLRTQIWKKE